MSSRILIAIPCLLPAGTERRALMLARALMERRLENDEGRHAFDVTVVCYFEHDEGMVSEFQRAGAEVILLDLDRGISPLRLTATLRSRFRSLRPSVIHVQYMAPGFLTVLAARLSGARVDATINYPATTVGPKGRFLVRAASLLTGRFVCVSEAVEKSWFGSSRLFDPLCSEGRKRRHVTIPNAVDVEAVDKAIGAVSPGELRSALGLGRGPVVCAAARLSREKGIDLLLEAFALVSSQVSGVQLLIAGDGAERESLVVQAGRLGVAGAVVWAGRRSWEDTVRLLALADVVAVPSRYEGFGLSAAEAMACGKPVAAFAVDGLCDLIEDGRTGALVPPGDTRGLAGAIAGLLQDPARRPALGLAAREAVATRFSYGLFAERQNALRSRT